MGNTNPKPVQVPTTSSSSSASTTSKKTTTTTNNTPTQKNNNNANAAAAAAAAAAPPPRSTTTTTTSTSTSSKNKIPTQREMMSAWHRYDVAVTDVYEIIETLGHGHMGEVYKVRRKVEDRGVHNSITRSRSSGHLNRLEQQGGGVGVGVDLFQLSRFEEEVSKGNNNKKKKKNNITKKVIKKPFSKVKKKLGSSSPNNTNTSSSTSTSNTSTAGCGNCTSEKKAKNDLIRPEYPDMPEPPPKVPPVNPTKPKSILKKNTSFSSIGNMVSRNNNNTNNSSSNEDTTTSEGEELNLSSGNEGVFEDGSLENSGSSQLVLDEDGGEGEVILVDDDDDDMVGSDGDGGGGGYGYMDMGEEMLVAVKNEEEKMEEIYEEKLHYVEMDDGQRMRKDDDVVDDATASSSVASTNPSLSSPKTLLRPVICSGTLLSHCSYDDADAAAVSAAVAGPTSILKRSKSLSYLQRRNGDKGSNNNDDGDDDSKVVVPTYEASRNVRFQRYYACKTVSTSRVKPGMLEELLNEINVMRTLDHPYILQLFEVYQVKRKIWIITELCTGGDLTNRKLNEAETTVILEQILRAIAYMHRRNIYHRDIKLENILYEHGGTNSTIRLIDFGLSRSFDRGSSSDNDEVVGVDNNNKKKKKGNKFVMTGYTMAPEAVAAEFGGKTKKKMTFTDKTDIWALGVVVWILLAGDYPFIKEYDELIKDKEKRDNLLNARYHYGITWKGRGITDHAKEFVSKCLKQNPNHRWTAHEALAFTQHTWIPSLEESDRNMRDRMIAAAAAKKKKNNGGANGNNGVDPDAPTPKLSNEILMQSISSKRRHQRTNNNDANKQNGIAHMEGGRNNNNNNNNQVQDGHVLDMESIHRFCQYGRLKKTILTMMAHTMDRRDAGWLRELFLTADATDSGTITLDDFTRAIRDLHPHFFNHSDNDKTTNQTIATIFNGMDQDGTGHIHYAEFLAALAESQGWITTERLSDVFDRIDASGKGHISHDDLRMVLGKDYDLELVDNMIKEADFKGNGLVDYEEFLHFMFHQEQQDDEDYVGKRNRSLDPLLPPSSSVGEASTLTESLHSTDFDGDLTSSSSAALFMDKRLDQ